MAYKIVKNNKNGYFDKNNYLFLIIFNFIPTVINACPVKIKSRFFFNFYTIFFLNNISPAKKSAILC